MVRFQTETVPELRCGDWPAAASGMFGADASLHTTHDALALRDTIVLPDQRHPTIYDNMLLTGRQIVIVGFQSRK